MIIFCFIQLVIKARWIFLKNDYQIEHKVQHTKITYDGIIIVVERIFLWETHNETPLQVHA